MSYGDVPRTADVDGFRFRAGYPSLDLCSTVLWRYVRPTELLESPHDLVRWIAESGLRPVPSSATDEDLRTALWLREAIYHLIRGRVEGTPPASGDIATVNEVAGRADPAPYVTADGGLGWSADSPTSAVLAAVARDAIELLTGSLADRLRECAAPDCAFLFVDRSRPGTRRWCAADRCGNRERVRDLRARRAGDPPDAEPPGQHRDPG